MGERRRASSFLTRGQDVELNSLLASLSDLGSFVASDYGLSFEFAEADRALFLAVGNDLIKVNGRDSWVLPVPVTYVIAAEGLIEYAAVNPNFTERPPIREITAALRELKVRSAEQEF